MSEPKSFSFSANNNIEISHSMPLHIDPCDRCGRTTLGDDADVQIVGYHWEYGDEGEGYEPSKWKEPNWLCKHCRLRLRKRAKSDFKKEDIGKRTVYVTPTLRTIEFDKENILK